MSSEHFAQTARDNIRKILLERRRSSFDVSVALGKNRTYLDDFIRGRKQSLGSEFSRTLSKLLDVDRAFIEGVVIIDPDEDLSNPPLPAPTNDAAIERRKEVLRQIEQFIGLRDRVGEGSSEHNLYCHRIDQLEDELIIIDKVIRAGDLLADNHNFLETKERSQWGLPQEFIVDQLGANPSSISMVRIEDSSMQRAVGTSFSPGDYVLINIEKKHTFIGGLYALSQGEYQFVRLIVPSATDTTNSIARAYNPDFPEIDLTTSTTVRVSGKVVAHLKRL